MIRDWLINLCCSLTCILCKEENRGLVCISSKQSIFWCWIHSFSVCQQITKKKFTHWWEELLNMFFLIYEATKIADSLSKFLCLYAMLLLWDNSKHGFSVAYKLILKVEINFGWSHLDKSNFWLNKFLHHLQKGLNIHSLQGV